MAGNGEREGIGEEGLGKVLKKWKGGVCGRRKARKCVEKK